MSSETSPLVLASRERYRSLVPELLMLFSEAFGRSASADFLVWRYLDNPEVDILACVESLSDGSLAASYSASPVRLLWNGKTLLSALSMTTMTAPQFAGKGLFSKLATTLYEEMSVRQYDLIWGFPNANSHRGFVTKLKWKDICEIPTMSLEVDASRPSKLPKSDAGVFYDDGFDMEYANIASVNPEMIMVARSREYLRWRYLRHPLNKYSVRCTGDGCHAHSYCITKTYLERELDIVDLVVVDSQQMELLLASVIREAHVKGIQRINCWAPLHHFCHSVYESCGFLVGAPVTYFGGRLISSERLTQVDIGAYSNWYLQMGDSDVY